MTQVVLALVLGALFAIGTYLVLRRDVVRVVWGVAIMSQAANVYLVTMGGVVGRAPVLGHDAEATTCAAAGAAGAAGEAGGAVAGCLTDPLVQALVLTAIVIGFGTTAFALVLTYRVYQEHGTIDLDGLGEVVR